MPPPVEVGGSARALVAGKVSTCALLEGGSVRCWGYNHEGQLGRNSTASAGDSPGSMPPQDSPIYPNPKP